MVWWGGYSDLEIQCMASWKEKLPDYKIIKWDETNFPINEHPYAKQAYDAGKWAFVSDYARVWILYHYGGIYLDTDYEIVENLDKYLKYNVFMGTENADYIGTAIIGAEKENWLMAEMLNYYNTHPFLLGNGKYDMIPNTMVLTDIMCSNRYARGQSALIKGIYVGTCMEFYPAGRSGCKDGTTAGIHYFRGSWWSEKERKRSTSKIYRRVFRPILVKGKKVIMRVLGPGLGRKIEIKVKNIMK